MRRCIHVTSRSDVNGMPPSAIDQHCLPSRSNVNCKCVDYGGRTAYRRLRAVIATANSGCNGFYGIKPANLPTVEVAEEMRRFLLANRVSMAGLSAGAAASKVTKLHKAERTVKVDALGDERALATNTVIVNINLMLASTKGFLREALNFCNMTCADARALVVHRVDTPWVKAPMKERILESQASGLRRSPFSNGWVMKMGRGFGDSPKHQTDAHAGAKQHGKPGQEVEFGLGSIWSERDVSPFGKNQAEGTN